MKIPFFSKSDNGEKTFFGVFLKEKEGRGLVMKMKNSVLSLLEDEKFSYSNGLENLAEDIDHVILKLEERTKLHLVDTIFFVYSHFIDPRTKEIQKTYFQKIKELVKKLDLKALGYIECYEAVVHYLQKKERLPLTAVMLEMDRTNLSVIVYKRGELIYSKALTHTNNLIDDLLACFQEIKGKFLLPSRIILYNSKDLDEEATEIVTHRWSEDLFIQLPRVEIIKEHEIIQGLVEVFGQQFTKGMEGQTMIAREEPENPKKEVMGFVIGGDVQDTTREELSVPATEPIKRASGINELKKSAFTNMINKIAIEIQKMIKTLPALPLHVKKKWTIPLGVVLVIAGIFLNEYFLHKATLTVFLPYEKIEKNMSVDVGLGQKKSGKFTIQTTTRITELTDSIASTGKKEIGEKAKGVVTLHNFDDSEKSFTKGTKLETGDLAFSLDQDVKVASSSVVTISGGIVKQPGKTKVNVTADEIGPQGNLSSGKKFTVAGSPSSLYFGMNESAFSGGTKKEIRTVSKDDLADLESKLVAKAKSQKLDKVKDNSQEKPLANLTKIDLSGLEYDKELGEEGDSVTLKARANAKLYFYDHQGFVDYLSSILQDEVPNGFILQKEKLQYTIKNAKENRNTVDLELIINANAIADVSAKEIVNSVKGKSKGSLEKLLKASYKATGFTIDIQPNVPILNGLTPFFNKNINLKIATL